MMNKQEAIDKLEKRLNMKSEFDSSDFDRGYDYGIQFAIDTVAKLYEPTKVVLNKEEAEWLKKAMELYLESDVLNFINRAGHGYNFYFKDEKGSIIRLHEEEEGCTKLKLSKAVLYGYEVEKEKLYTVKFSNEDFGKIYIGIFKAFNKLGISSLPLNDADVK